MLLLDANTHHEYKYVVKMEGSEEVVWELDGMDNRVLEVGDDGALWVDDGQFGERGRVGIRRMEDEGGEVSGEVSGDGGNLKDDEAGRDAEEGEEGAKVEKGRELDSWTVNEVAEMINDDISGSVGDVKSIKNKIRELRGKKDSDEEEEDNTKVEEKEESPVISDEEDKESQVSSVEVWSILDGEMRETLKDIETVKDQLNKVRAKRRKGSSTVGVGMTFVVVAVMFIGACVAVLFANGGWKEKRRRFFL